MRVLVQYLLQASTVSTAYVHQRHLATLCGSQLAKVEMSDERESRYQVQKARLGKFMHSGSCAMIAQTGVPSVVKWIVGFGGVR
jgi:hypothetical protein